MNLNRRCSICKVRFVMDDSPSGPRYWCQYCANFKKREYDKKRRDKTRLYNRNWREANKEYRKLRDKAYYADNKRRILDRRDPIKIKARSILNTAVKFGRVVKQPCRICGSPKSTAHHFDYSKPLEVDWLCMLHHIEVYHMKRLNLQKVEATV